MGDTERAWRDHYNRTARQYDRKERLWGLLMGYSDEGERRKLVSLLHVKPGQRLLEVSAGTGSNLAVVAEQAGPEVVMVGADISREMLSVCRGKLSRRNAGLVESDAAHLPFKSDAFDALLHFGGLSMFSDKKTAIDEMVRVVKPGGRIVMGDVGMSPQEQTSLRRRIILRANSRYASKPPVELLPSDARDVSVNWFRNGTCYFIELVKADG